jgi:hypothetical protein
MGRSNDIGELETAMLALPRTGILTATADSHRRGEVGIAPR